MEIDLSQNYYDLFDIAPSFNIDLTRLRSKFQQLQGKLHPDRHVNSTHREKREALQAASFVNEAYQVLSDEHRRARYLLQLRGVEFNQEQDTTDDMEFLLTQMHLREKIEGLDGSSEPIVTIEELVVEADKSKRDLIAEFERHYNDNHYEQAKQTVLKLQFFTRLQQQLATKQDQLEEFYR